MRVSHHGVYPVWSAFQAGRRLAVECGYCDQPHLIRDFQIFSDFTPDGFLPQNGAERPLQGHVPLNGSGVGRFYLILKQAAEGKNEVEEARFC